MSAIADIAAVPPVQKLRPSGVLHLWLVAMAGLAVMSLPNLLDPMMRFDDFPALLAEPSGFWAKTLHEGRWVNYLWHLREIVTPAWLNFAVYQMLWGLFASCLAFVAFARNGLAACLCALMIVVAPPATLISLWFNTLLPGLALVALYAWLATQVSTRILRAVLPPFVVLSFMAYTTYPLLLLAVCLAQTRQHCLRDLTALMVLFGVSFAAAVLAVYGLNFAVHGVFGVPLADWRGATPAVDVAGLRANLPLIWQSLRELGDKASFGFSGMVWFHLALLSASGVVLLRRVPGEGFYLVAGLLAGLALVAVQILKMGALVPPRGFIFAWVFYALIAGRAVDVLSAGVPLRLLKNAVLLVIGSYALQTFQQYSTYRAWQAESRAIVRSVQDGPVAVRRDVDTAASAQAAFVQNPLALSYRVKQIRGQTATVCAERTCPEAVSVIGVENGRLRLF